MFINVRKNGNIELSATGSDEMSLLRRYADGVRVQAFDDSQAHANFLILTPELDVKEGRHAQQDNTV